MYNLTITGPKTTSSPAPGLIEDETEVTLRCTEAGQSVCSFQLGGVINLLICRGSN
jgi:hypothetical protein